MSYKDFLTKLTSIAEPFQAEAELNLILEHVGFSKKDFLLGKNLREEQIATINDIIKTRTLKRIPIQHILGYGYFMGEKFEVSPDVLIPRPETEILVQKIAEIEGKTLLDIGTGSGCIAIMTQKLSDKKVWACDISEKALRIAQKNAHALKADVTFVQSDLFENIEGKFDIIVSNPPYIPKSTMPDLTEEVACHEPHLALFAEDEHGVDFYQKIIKKSPEYLNPKGFLAFEIGIDQAEIIRNMLLKQGFEDIETIKDFAQIERIIIARLHKNP